MVSTASFFCIAIAVFHLGDCAKQTAGVRGVLMCGNVPAQNVKVKLYDDDTGPDLDDMMAEGTTDSLGQFLLHGTASELLTIDPKLNIYHDCEDGKPCQRKVSIHLPKSYVIKDRESPSHYFDIGILNLEGEFEGEERDCIH
ncbi:unnamed protein product, partial [Mesorhabditis spiculigera]